MPERSESKTTESPGPFTPAERRHAQRVALIAWGVFGSAWMAMVGGAPYVTFVRERLHVTTFQYGLLSSLPTLAVFAQIPGSLLVEHWRARRKLFLWAAASSRLTWLLVAALPWVIPASRPQVRIAVFLGLMVLSALLSHFCTPAWFSWFGDMVTERVRGRYLGRRAALATVTGVVVGLSVPRIVDWNSSFSVFAGVFAAAAVLGVTDIFLFFSVREPPMPEATEEKSPWGTALAFLEPWRDLRFRGYLLYSFSESFMFGIAGAFFMLLALEYLKMDNFWATFYVSIIPMVCTAVTLPLWGRACDRFGYRPLLTFGTLASIAFPMFWLLATPGCYIPFAAAAALIGGTCTPAVQAADMSMMYALTPRENRSGYIAYLMLAASAGAFLAPLLSGIAADRFEHVQVQVWGLTLHNLHFILLASMAARLLHTIFIVPHLPEENPRRTRELARYLVDGSLSRVSPRKTRTTEEPAEAEPPKE